MSRHEGVSCDNCLTSNFQVKRFKCLICYDYDLCEICYEYNVSTSRHLSSHPMQCILTKYDFDLFYGGENIPTDHPPALTCPFCGKRGLTEANLQQHVISQHAGTTTEVVCPICATVPTGDPNHITDDFVGHLSIEHSNTQPLIAAASAAGRPSVRRMFFPGRNVSVRGARAQRSANSMHFSGGPSSVPGFGSLANAAASPYMTSTREPYIDPIAELLSQLSGVRRNAQQLQHTVSTVSQLQQLQARLQVERQRTAITRQRVDAPGRNQSNQSGKQTGNQSTNDQHKSNAAVAKTKEQAKPVKITEDEDPRLLLSQRLEIMDQMEGDNHEESDIVSDSRSMDVFEQCLFTRELILALSIDDNDSFPLANSASSPALPTSARAIPVECGALRASASGRNLGSTEKTTVTSKRGNGDKFHPSGGESAGDRGTAGGLSPRGTGKMNVAGPRSAAVFSQTADLKKESGNLRSPQPYSSAGSDAASLAVRSPSRSVPSFPLLVSGTTEQ